MGNRIFLDYTSSTNTSHTCTIRVVPDVLIRMQYQGAAKCNVDWCDDLYVSLVDSFIRWA